MSSRQFIKILYEDKDLLVVDKPAGVLSEPKADSPRPDMVRRIKEYLRRKYKGIKNSYVKLLHRLDAETSGAMVVGLSGAAEGLLSDFESHRVDRRYVAVVEGAVNQHSGRIDLPLEKGEFQFGKKVRIAPSGSGKKARTDFEVMERYPNATVLRLTVQTGRTHQVRVHLAAIGHPLVGDQVYGAGAIPFRRQALHAQFLGFRHPRTGKKIRVESPLPSDIRGLIDDLRGSV